MYKQRFYSIISIFLCITILFSYMPLHVFAEENIATDSNATTTYVFDENGNEICSECGNSTFHSEDCSLYEESSGDTVSDIVKNIESTSKNLTVGKEETIRTDIPEVPFMILLFAMVIMFVLTKRVTYYDN